MAVTFSGKDKLQRFARLYCDGYDLSGDVITFSNLQCNEEEVDLTGWSNLTTYWTVSGRRALGVSGLNVFMNPDTGAAFDQLKGAPRAQNLSLVFGGNSTVTPAIGCPSYIFPALIMSDSMSIDNHRAILTIDNLFVDSANYDDEANFPLGRCVQNAVQKSALWSSDAVDFEADQAGTIIGMQATIHILEISGTTWTLKVQDSPNDVAWADVITFTVDGSALESERLSVATQVDRYVRLDASPAGAGTITVVCCVGRRTRA